MSSLVNTDKLRDIAELEFGDVVAEVVLNELHLSTSLS
jgi:hypothetical protein